MKSSIVPALRRVVALAPFFTALAAFTLGGVEGLYAADAPVTVSETTHDTTRAATTGGPTVTSHSTYWVLDNGIVKAIINKKTGELESLFYKGVDRAGHDQGAVGPWEQDPSGAEAANALTSSITIDPAKNGGERAEVSVKGVTGGTITLTPNAPGGGTNFDLEIRYAMGRGDSGVYTYAIYTHPASYGPGRMGSESRFIFRINQSFDWISVDADRNLLAAGPLNWGTGVVVHAKEQRLMSQGPYKNSVEHKYTYNGVQYKIPAYGWSSTQEHVGVWFINPTIEYLTGGASKKELQTHYGDNDNPDPIILDYWKGSHYGGSDLTVAAGEEWSKVVGPIFVYVNSLDQFETPSDKDMATFTASFGNPIVPKAWQDNATALWQDALKQAAAEKAKWPYDWVNGVDYPHKNQRANVTGQIVLNDPLAPPGTSTKLPHLTVGLAYPDPAGGQRGGRGGFGGGGGRGWAYDAKHYEFWNDGSEDGKFTLTEVRPGNYQLHAWADGVLGTFNYATNITVEAGKDIDLGKLVWKPVRYGTQVWDIGYADRSAREFLKGDGANYWLWGWPLRYALLFPNDLTYTVGKSDPAKDWFFEEVPHATDLSFVNPDAKDPANQRFGWVKSESLDQYPQTDTTGPWRIYGRGNATTWTIKFNMDKSPQGYAALRIALDGADGGGLAIAVNGTDVGSLRPLGTNALRYNTDSTVWQELVQTFDASLLKKGENTITLTVPAGEVTSGVVYDYLRLELNELYKLDGTRIASTQ